MLRFNRSHLPLDQKMQDFWDINGFLVIEDFYTHEECDKLIHKSEKLIDDHGIYAQPIFYPTVPKGLERLRITVTPKHRKEHIENMIYCLDKVWSDLSLPRKNSTKLKINI